MALENYVDLELKKISGIGDETAPKIRTALLKLYPKISKDSDIRELLREYSYSTNKSIIKLNVLTKADLKYNPIKHIKHDIITQIFTSLKKTKTIPATAELAGSYRRGKSFSSDIDILVKSESMLKLKHFANVISEKGEAHLLPPHASGPKKWMTMVKYKNKYYKVDIYFCGSAHASMLLYLTGSYEFNIWMRTLALEKGYFLNQNGLYKKKAGEHILVKTKTERDIFAKLDIKYIKPEDREVPL